MAKQTFTTGQVLTAAQMTSLQQTAMGGGSTTAKTTSYVLTAADAGTVVQMNAAGATTITVNTALFAAGDSVQIQNIGAGVCTVTAGTATVSTAGSLALSQYEGGQLYFNSTGAAIFFDVVQSSGSTSVGCAVNITTNQTLTNGATTVINYANEVFDTNGFHDNTTNPSRITIPTGYAGKYIVNGGSIIGDKTTGRMIGVISKNGSAILQTNWGNNSSQSGGETNGVLSLAVGDYITFAVYQASGSDASTGTDGNYNRFSAIYLGA